MANDDSTNARAHDALTIWGGEKGSPAYSKGTFGEDRDTLSSEWVYPGGGGYRSTMARVH
jgi:hypothetical protein